jgi:hypothetical protein
MGFMNVGQKVYVAKNVTIVGIENISFLSRPVCL